MTKYSLLHAAILEKAALFMRNNLQESLLIEKIAWQAGFSESHFRKLFRKFYGISPGSFLQYIRISQAKELMVYSSRSQTEIAELCGYETVHSFSKAFKKHEGISPRQYRNYGIAEIETQQASG